MKAAGAPQILKRFPLEFNVFFIPHDCGVTDGKEAVFSIALLSFNHVVSQT